MEQVLRLNWPRCADGYDLIQFDSRKVDWPRYRRDKDPNQQQLSRDEKKFLAIWGELSESYQPGDETEQWFLAKTNRVASSNIMAKEPRLFLEFAETKSDPNRQRKFINDYGLLFRSPCALTTVNYWASTFDHLIKRRKSEMRRNQSRWLTDAMNLFGYSLDNDLHIDPEIHNGDVRLVLKPNDLVFAMLIQFVFSKSINTSVSHCAYCDNLILKGPRQARVDRKYCSNSCRQRDYRRRIKG